MSILERVDDCGALPHGGRVREATKRYGIPPAEWLDLSTGINPNGWPVPPIPPGVWSRLPEDDDELLDQARGYYGTSSLLPVAGSQAAIQALPRLRAPAHVSVIHPGYAEHAHAWRRAGHRVTLVSPTALGDAAAQADVLLLIHPNNPSGERFSRDQLLAWHDMLRRRGGWLIVDEAFIDPTPDQSLIPLCPLPGVIVLRSLGKFFGLAGVRVGFVSAEPALSERLRDALGPWSVATSSRWVATRALADRAWQRTARLHLQAAGARLAKLLGSHNLVPRNGCALFQWVPHTKARELHEAFARSGILTRLLETPLSLRIGLPGSEADWSRLETRLVEIRPETNGAST